MTIRLFFVPILILGVLAINLDSPFQSDVYLDSDAMYSIEMEMDSMLEEEIQVLCSPISFCPASTRILSCTQDGLLERSTRVETPPPQFC